MTPARMEHIVHLCPRCDWRADWVVRDTQDAEVGYYCKRHARLEVARLNREADQR